MQNESLLKLIKRIAPEQLLEIGRRAQVLTGIETMQPVGRRALSTRLNLSEREVRAIATSLKDQGLLTLNAAGMQLTAKAQDVLPGARDLSRALFGLNDLSQQLAHFLKVDYVVVIAGDADEDKQVLKEVGRSAAHRIKQLLSNGITLAIGGGSTMLEISRGISSSVAHDIMVVPARGGIGSMVETQASVVAVEMARKLGASYRVIHLPDSVDEATLQKMCKQKDVRETIELLQKADVVVHGICGTMQTAKHRGMNAEECDALIDAGAKGEALGDFFDINGKMVRQIKTVSYELTKMQKKPIMVAVAAGNSKAEAIIACIRHAPHNSLITDEGAANEMLALLKKPMQNL